MAVDFIDNNAFVQQIIDNGKAEAGKRGSSELGKEDFLNLLILQLRYQDPLNPVDDKEFIAQMAQFSALEQMQNMNASNTAMKGFSMIGKYVTATLADEATGINRIVEGHVESVIMKGSKTFVVVAGKEIPIDNVYNVADGFNPLNSSLSTYTGLIGYYVKGAVYDLSTGEIVGVSGEVMSLAKGTYEDFAMLNGVSAVVAGVNKKGEIEEDRAKLKAYLESVMAKANPADRHVEIFITDGSGKKVPIGATLRSYEVDPVFGTVKAVLDDVAAPVASVSAIKKAGAGTDGAAGAAGADGATGAAGADGAAGASGTSGASGASGAAGATGADGASGASGTDGTDNTDGASGTGGAGSANGTDGTAGTGGAGGTDEATGTSGTAGADGAGGTSGADGASGAAGADGADGASGAAGAGGDNDGTGG